VKNLENWFARYFFSDAVPMEVRTLNVVYLLGILALGAGIMFRYMIGGADPALWMTVFLLLTALGIFYFNARTRLHFLGTGIYLFIQGNIAFPFIFFATGGQSSGIDSYFVLSIFLIFLIMKGKPLVFLLIVQIAVILACYSIDYAFPGFSLPLTPLPLTPFQLALENFQGVFIAALFIGLVVKFRTDIIYNDHEKLNKANMRLARQEAMLHAVNEMALGLLTMEKENQAETFQKSLQTMARCVDVERAQIWRNEMLDGRIYYTNISKWLGSASSEHLSQSLTAQNQTSFSYSESFPCWKDRLEQKQIINSPVSKLSQIEQALLSPYGIQSILVIPIFLQNHFWGFISFDDCQKERSFTETEVSILQSGSLLLASALVHVNMLAEIERRETMLDTINTASAMLLKSEADTFEKDLRHSMSIMVRGINADRFRIWKNHSMDGALYCTEVYEWSENVESQMGKAIVRDISYSETLPGWEETLSSGKSVGGIVRHLSQAEQDQLLPQGILSFLAAPVFFQDKFWGFVAFDDCHAERIFSSDEEELLRSGGLLIANAMRRNHNESLISLRLEEEELMADISQSFISEENISSLINHALRQTGKFIGASRVLVSVIDNETRESKPYYYWCASDDLIPVGQTGLDELILSAFPKLILPEDDIPIICCNDIHTEADGKYEAMGIVGLNSFIWAPLYIHNEYWGLLGIEDCTGVRIWNESDIQLVRMVRGTIAGAISKDLAEQKRIAADKRTHAMLDTTPLACIFQDDKGTVVDCNLAALLLFGVDEKEEFFRRYRDLRPEFQPDGKNSNEVTREFIKNAFETGRQFFEFTYSTAMGEPIAAESTLVRIEWNDIHCIATYIRDLREIKANEQKAREADRRSRELEIATQAAQAASEAKSQFLASMSHEIRTPMNAIIGMSDLMRMDNLDATQRRYFQDIRRMSYSLLSIINDILDFSKIEAGKMKLILADYDIFALYDNICSLTRFTVSGKSLELRHGVGSDIPRVLFGDEIRVRQIIVNLVNNAVKYTQNGYVELRLERLEKNGGAYLSIMVKDTGIGIKKENFTRLFDRFEQVDSLKNRGITGTGLGLPIVKNLVDLMGGEILLESEYGKGSVFTVLLPLVAGNPDNVRQTSGLQRVMVSPEVKALVVDDNTTNLAVALGYLLRHGIQADTADSGAAALKMLQEKQYDLVFMDHMMPDMDGLETTRRIRALGGEHYTKLPIIALSANAITGARELFLASGMNDFISKPIGPHELNAALIKWLPPDKLSFPEVAAPAPVYDGMDRRSTRRRKTDQSSAPARGEEGDKRVVIDQEAGIAGLQNDEQLYREILVDFRQENQGAIEEIRNRLAANEGEAARRLAHTLKSTAALIGAERLRQAALAVEMALAGDGCADSQLETLESELRLVLAELERLIPKPPQSAGDDIEAGRENQ
jgi:signal transduction histidine kinase/HPt (histidine-containing phosphotransfer) domain-containing protein/FixJ family two-component response regulator